MSIQQPLDGTSATRTAEMQFAAVREQLVERRRALGMSMSALARRVGVSPSMISQIERGQSLPSVETLFALAAALGATVDTFFSTSQSEPLEEAGRTRPPAQGETRDPATGAAGEHSYVVRRDRRAAINIQGGVRWERLTPQTLEDVEFLELIYEPGAESNEDLYRHSGFEMVMVLEGRFEIQIGFEKHVLEPGDSIAFASSLPHRYRNLLSEPSRAITTILRDPALLIQPISADLGT